MQGDKAVECEGHPKDLRDLFAETHVSDYVSKPPPPPSNNAIPKYAFRPLPPPSNKAIALGWKKK